MNKTYHFISGLPRSGSTLLCNILMQNPRFWASATSGILDVMFGVRNQWDKLIEFRAIDPAESAAAKLRVLRGILDTYYADVDRPVVFDKSRGWLAHLEMAEAVLGRRAKVLVPVRDPRDVLASFELLWRKTSATRQMAQEPANYFQFQTVEGRCEVWCQSDQPVGLAYNRVKDALARGFRDRMYFVEFEKLTRNPKRTMRTVYEFLDEPCFDHDFDHVEQVTFENDDVHGIPDLHTIQPKITPIPPRWPSVLGNAANKYAGLELW